MPTDGVPISSNQPIFGIPGQENIDANLEDSACTVRLLLFFPIVQISTTHDSQTTLKPNLDWILGQIAT